MSTNKNLGIWMDHSTAKLMAFGDLRKMDTIDSAFTHTNKVDALHRSESLMHNKEQQLHQEFYKELAAEILKYEHVLLFGPTNAKTELHNFLKKDLHFENIKIDIESADKMSDNEQSAFVKNHFNNTTS